VVGRSGERVVLCVCGCCFSIDPELFFERDQLRIRCGAGTEVHRCDSQQLTTTRL
jgi:hypothetical protein